jgi:hypothetical protein
MGTVKYNNIDVPTEVRKIASSKPVHAAAGAGVLATQTLRELPGRIVRGIDGTVTSLPGTVLSLPGTVLSLPGTVLSLPGRATSYVQSARDKAVDGYDMLAARGRKALDGPARTTTHHTTTAHTSGTSAKSSSTSGASTRSTASKSTATRTAPAKTALNGKDK